MTIRQVLKWEDNYPGVEWEAFRRANYYKPKDLTEAAGEPYETLDDELPFMSNYYTLQYKDYYNNEVSYVEQFYHNAEFSSNSVFEIVFKESADGSTGDANEGCSVYEHLIAGNYYWATKAVVLEIFGSTDGRGQNPQILGHSEYASDGQRVEPGSGRFVSGKWYTPLAERPQYMYDNGKNRRWMRYSEVVLMYAEALNESGLPARALDQLNSVKAQANTINNNSELYKAGGYSLMRDNIWKERRAELSFEFDRFFDIVRQGRAASVLHAFGAPRVNRRGLYFIEGVNEVFPIPQNEVDLSNGVIAQNPGY